MKNEIITKAVKEYITQFNDENDYLAPLIEMLDGTSDVSSRKNSSGHVTASALLLNANDDALVIHHRSLNKVLFPGGHLEAEDKNPEAAALRELVEESGIPENLIMRATNSLTLIDIDRHGIPENSKKGEPAHEHWDILYAFRLNVAMCEVKIDTNEVTGFSWQPRSALSPKIRSRLQKLGC
jgi:8-oxo-dGTP pyrophosphatase MutT (NUDIX family)